jgi:8-amino-7-oxononanoate synthase
LAKGFGAPLAVIAGNAKLITKFKVLSATRVHTSPPSLAAINAAQRALAINGTRGDLLRISLAKLVRHFRQELRQIGLSALGGLFPVQTLEIIPDVDPRHLHTRLRSCGVRAVLHSVRHMPNAAVSFLITLLHTWSDIGRCMDALRHSCVLARLQRGTRDRVFGREGSEIFA